MARGDICACACAWHAHYELILLLPRMHHASADRIALISTTFFLVNSFKQRLVPALFPPNPDPNLNPDPKPNSNPNPNP